MKEIYEVRKWAFELYLDKLKDSRRGSAYGTKLKDLARTAIQLRYLANRSVNQMVIAPPMHSVIYAMLTDEKRFVVREHMPEHPIDIVPIECRPTYKQEVLDKKTGYTWVFERRLKQCAAGALGVRWRIADKIPVAGLSTDEEWLMREAIKVIQDNHTKRVARVKNYLFKRSERSARAKINAVYQGGV
ncbi:hypothetical protein [Vibrio phage VCPH]|nr:hypothetical protein [Vibrio phage VCPH]